MKPVRNHSVKAIEVLSRMGEFAAPAVPNLIRLLEDEDADMRLWAAEALGHLKEVSAAAVPMLIEMLGDEDTDVRRGATHALARINASARA